MGLSLSIFVMLCLSIVSGSFSGTRGWQVLLFVGWQVLVGGWQVLV